MKILKFTFPSRGKGQETEQISLFEPREKQSDLKTIFSHLLRLPCANFGLYYTNTDYIASRYSLLNAENRERIQSSACDTGVFVFAERRAMTFRNYPTGNNGYTIELQFCTSRELIFSVFLLFTPSNQVFDIVSPSNWPWNIFVRMSLPCPPLHSRTPALLTPLSLRTPVFTPGKTS